MDLNCIIQLPTHRYTFYSRCCENINTTLCERLLFSRMKIKRHRNLNDQVTANAYVVNQNWIDH